MLTGFGLTGFTQVFYLQTDSEHRFVLDRFHAKTAN